MAPREAEAECPLVRRSLVRYPLVRYLLVRYLLVVMTILLTCEAKLCAGTKA